MLTRTGLRFIVFVALAGGLGAAAQDDGTVPVRAELGADDEKTSLTSEASLSDYAISVSVKKCNGDSVAGQSFALTHLLPGSETTVAEGTVPPSGVLEFTGLAGGNKWTSYYLLSVDEGPVSDLSPSNTFLLDGDVRQRHVEFTLACGEGDYAPNVSVVDVASGESVDLHSYLGKVVFLDFWATWCQACHGPLARNDEILGRRKDWEDKATILAISIDEMLELPHDYMAKKGLTNIPSFWAPVERGYGFLRDSEAAQAFGIVIIPQTILIDQAGIIRARGHDLDPESLIDELLLE